MRMVELIQKKRDGQALGDEEISWMISSYVNGEVPDYQMSAMLMAIVLKGMDEKETTTMTLKMADSGQRLDLSAIPGIKVDKHSTGGVGDKATLMLIPLIASLGVPVAKMSGRGLGHTGGTIDKLECFPGFDTGIDNARFIRQVRELGGAIMGQTEDLCPADKKLYALRDVTGTVESIPLIASSIMSKKIAAGADAIVLEVMCGSGAFMKNEKDARALADSMVKIGKLSGKRTHAVITNMNEPLGEAVGNALEVIEAIETLKGRGNSELKEVVFELGSHMLILNGRAVDREEAFSLMQDVIDDGSALNKLREIVNAQGGDTKAIDDYSLFPAAKVVRSVKAEEKKYLAGMNCEEVGRIVCRLGGGREVKDAKVDLSVGMKLFKKQGDLLSPGEVIAEIHAGDEMSALEAERAYLSCLELSDTPAERLKLILGNISS
ncbi:MAG: pyrimidine-nucleoside phosphorylase [Lachnospiraceae bacterium]|nr:pyrimidine-nucleoside phosphorylase [Lachnospiraceae bacterium]